MSTTIDLTTHALIERSSDNAWKEAIVCHGLLNPRGLRFTNNGDLLLIEAGRAEFKPPYSGQLTVRDRNTGLIKKTLLKNYRALNMQARMCRDEIMGLADIAPYPAESARAVEQTWLVAFTDYIDGSKILQVNGDQVTSVFDTKGNINGLCYHPARHAWYGVKPDTNEVVEFILDQPERIVCVLPDLALGQEAVPVNIVYQASSGHLLISLFSGELGRGDEFKGIDFVKQQGGIVAVEPETGEVIELVTGLTLPTGLCLTDDDKILVTELCEDFLQPLPPDHLPKEASNGGFKRFSGRLLRIDLASKRVEQLAIGLDTPSNLVVYEGAIYISEGMGLPGRLIPSTGGPKALDGFVRRIIMA